MNPSDKTRLTTVDQVVDEIIDELPLEAKVSRANLDEDEFRVVELTLGKLIRYKLDQVDFGVKTELMKDCLAKAGEPLNEVDAATVIIKELWNRLRKTHRLRVVK